MNCTRVTKLLSSKDPRTVMGQLSSRPSASTVSVQERALQNDSRKHAGYCSLGLEREFDTYHVAANSLVLSVGKWFKCDHKP